MLHTILFGNKKEEEIFDLGECSFDADQEISPLEYFKENKFFGHVELENLCFLFTHLPTHYFDCKNRRTYKRSTAVFKEIYFMVCVYDIYNWTCHQAAPYFSVQKTDWDYMFGFAYQRLDTGKIHTFLHSFNAKGEIFVDLTIQSKHQQHADWVKSGTFKDTGFKPEDFYKYVGIRFPTHLVEKIVFGNENKTGNVWGYLIDEVLCSAEKTTEFVKSLKV